MGGVFLPAGKAHLRRAVGHHEESVREASLCKKLRHIDMLREVLCAAHQRSRLKYAQHQEDDDLLNLMDAPDIICEWPGSPCVQGHSPCLLIPEGSADSAACWALLSPWSYLLLTRCRAFFMVVVACDCLGFRAPCHLASVLITFMTPLADWSCPIPPPPQALLRVYCRWFASSRCLSLKSHNLPGVPAITCVRRSWNLPWP